MEGTWILLCAILSFALTQLLEGVQNPIIQEEGEDVQFHFDSSSTQNTLLVLERNGTAIYKFRPGEINNIRSKQIELTRLEGKIRITLKDVDTSDTGSYECLLHGVTQAPLYYLTVVPSVIDFSIRDSSGLSYADNSVIPLVEGTLLELICRFDGGLRSDWTIGWIINGTRLPQDDERVTLSEFDDYHEESVLHIAVTDTTLDGAWIICEARGEQISLTLEVTKRPFLQLSGDLTEGIPSALICILNETVSRPPTFQWSLDGNDISSNSSRNQLTEIWYSRLEFYPMRSYLDRQLKCTINNEEGRFDSVVLDMNYCDMILQHRRYNLKDTDV